MVQRKIRRCVNEIVNFDITQRKINGKKGVAKLVSIGDSIDWKNHQEKNFLPFQIISLMSIIISVFCHLAMFFCQKLFFSIFYPDPCNSVLNRRSMTLGITKNEHLLREEGLDSWNVRDVKWKKRKTKNTRFPSLFRREKKKNIESNWGS